MIEFAALAAALLAQSRSLLPSWFPAGKWRGQEFVVGDLAGNPGDSLSINSNTGKWSEFAGTDKGGDLISLYAAQHRLSQGDAAAQLTKLHLPETPAPTRKAKNLQRHVIAPVPAEAPRCECIHYEYGKPSQLWEYRDAAGALMGYVARYDLGNSKKEVLPWTYGAPQGQKPYWRLGSWPEPRPLYGVDDPRLATDRTTPILIVEGEKTADAARKLAPSYIVLTWPGGSKSWKKADWARLAGRKEILLWPDADDPGIKCMWEIGHHLFTRCETVKIIMPDGKADGWDAADAVAEGWDWAQFKTWATPRRKIITESGTLEDQPAPETATTVTVSGQSKRPVTIVGRWTEWGLLGPNNSSNGQPYSDLNNAARVLEVDPLLQNRVWYDEFLGRILTISNPHPREWQDVDDVDLTLYLQREIGLKKIAGAVVRDAVMQVAYRRKRNCVQDWVNSLKWDSEPRIDQFFEDRYGAPATEYSRAASRNFWLSLVARIFRPGCKVDNMIVLEGPQGLGKGKGLRVIAREWFTEQHEGASDPKRFGEILQGKLLVEIVEMDSFVRAEMTRVKATVSNQVDRFRPAYGHGYAKDHPRQCIFVGTTNRDDWNKDETGARRFWPIHCTEVDVEGIRQNREQYFAEAVARLHPAGGWNEESEHFNGGELWWQMPEDDTRQEQRKRYDADVWLEPIQTFVALKTGVTVLEILEECLGREPGDCTHSDKLRVTACLRAMAWQVALERSGRDVQRVWRRNDG